MPKEETIEIINRENDPCETCGYAEGSPFCLQYCPYDAERKKEQEPYNTISREEVLNLVNKWLYFDSSFNLEGALSDLPPVTPSRPKGHWIKNKGYDKRDNFYTCSVCGRTINVICGETLNNYPYCHCGAEMESEG